MADLRGMPADLSRFYPLPPTLAQLGYSLDEAPFISGADEPDLDRLADFKVALELTGERWLSFSEAAALLRKREPMSIGQAEATIDDLRIAYFADGGPFDRQSGKSATVRWQWFHDTDFQKNKPNRGNTFVSEADLIHWHNVMLAVTELVDKTSAPTKSAPSAAERKKRDGPKTYAAKRAIEALYPNEIPDQAAVANKVLCNAVRDWHKADCQKRDIPHRSISDDVIKRAAGRRK